jgi:hypothetical protein
MGSLGLAPALPTNIMLVRKCLTVKNNLAYYDTKLIPTVKSFIQTTGANFVKLSLSMIYGFSYQASVCYTRLEKSLQMTNTLSYYEKPQFTAVKSFITLGPWSIFSEQRERRKVI